MKKIIYYSILLLLFTACKNNRTPKKKQYNFTPNDKVNVVFYENLHEQSVFTYISTLEKTYKKTTHSNKHLDHLSNLRSTQYPLSIHTRDTLELRKIINANIQLLPLNTIALFGKNEYEKSKEKVKLFLVKVDTKFEALTHITSATAVKDNQINKDVLNIVFDKDGQSKFSHLSGIAAETRGQIAIASNNFILSSPTVTQKIYTDSVCISGYMNDLNLDSLGQLINYSIKKNK